MQNSEIPGTYIFVDETEKAEIERNFPQFINEGIAFEVGNTVAPVNNLPLVDADKTIIVEEDSANVNLNINEPTDIDGDNLTITIGELPDNSLGNITLADSTPVAVDDTLTVEQLTSLIFTSVANANGDGGNFVYTVDDGNSGTASQTISFVINPVNDLPIAGDNNYTIDEDTELMITPPGVLENDSDIDGDSLTAEIVDQPSNGALAFNEDGSFTYTPNANFAGEDNFTYRSDDNTSLSSIATVTITVTPVNDLPIADVDKTITLDEDSDSVALDIASPTDVDGDDPNITISELPDQGRGNVTLADGTPIAVNDTLTIDQLASLIFTPVANANGDGGSFVYTADDGNGGTASQTISFVINPINNLPIVEANKVITVEEASQGISLNISQPTDIDDDDLTITIDELPDITKGNLTLADGSIVNVNDEISIGQLSSLIFTPVTNANGDGGNFVYTVNDGNGGIVSQTVSFFIGLNLETLTGTQIINNSVGGDDPVDFYQFNINSLSNLILDLENLSSDADVALVQDFNDNNQIDQGEVVTLSALEGTESENIDVILTEGNYFIIIEPFEGETNYDLNLSVFEATEFPEEAEAVLSNTSETAFNALGSSVEFNLSGLEPSQVPTIRAYFNGEDVSDIVVVTENNITIPSTLAEGLNEILLYGVREQGFSLLNELTLWAGNETIEALVLDENGQPVNNASVAAKLADNQDVISELVTDENGRVVFSNLPGRTILFEAVDSNNNFDAVGAIGTENQVVLNLRGFSEPSNIDNNDFSLGLDGWNIGDAPVDLVSNQESEQTLEVQSSEISVFSTNDTELFNSTPIINRSEESREGISRTELNNNTSFELINHEDPMLQDQSLELSTLTTANAELPDIDLVLNTSGEGEQTISRTFTTEPGTQCVTLRYQFITSEVPGGFFGSEFNDYFSVSIRSQNEGSVVQETNSMNGLGLGAFDASGATEFREITLPVSEEGDTVQVDITVANVADDQFNSQVVVDSIDPSELELDYQEVNIDFKAFIPSQAVSLTNKFFSFIPFDIFGGDNRGFGASANSPGSSRFTQEVTVITDPDQSPTVVSPSRTWGTTTRYDSSQGDRVSGQPFWFWSINTGESPQASDTLPVTNSNNNVTVERISEDTVKVNLDISGSNPLQFGAPKLDASVDVFIRQQSPCHTPEYAFRGVIDGFPAYELFINDQPVFQADPRDFNVGFGGNTPFELLPLAGDVFFSQGFQLVPDSE